MDELEVAGKKYISSKRASQLTGYAKDYIGQLLRSGKVTGTRFGRAWYVEESEILRHAGKAPSAEIVSSVPVTSSPVVPVSVPDVPISRPTVSKPAKPLLSPHMITPAILPQTWSSIKYLEDSSDLFPVATDLVEVIESKSIQEEKAAADNDEHRVPVTIRERRARESRVQQLVDGIRPKTPVLRVAQPKIVTPAPIKKETPVLKKHIPSLNKSLMVKWSPGSFTTAFASFVLVLGVFSFLSLLEQAGRVPAEGLTASTFYSLDDFIQLIREARIIDHGRDAIVGFFTLLRDSFSSFLRAGIDFILNLF